MTQPQQQLIACADCGLARISVPVAGTTKLTIVGSVQQIAPCPFCVFRADMVNNLEAAERVINELQGMADPVVVEAPA